MKTRYFVVRASEKEDLEERVNARLSKGWKCQGGVCSMVVPAGGMPTDTYYLQAMLKGAT